MPIALALALIATALLVGLVFGGLAYQWAQEEGDDGEDELAPAFTIDRFGAVQELRPDGYWYIDGKRVV